MTMINVPEPGMSSDGDWDPAEDTMEAVDAASGGTWSPESAHKSPLQMQEEARLMNHLGAAHIAAHAGNHSQPPAPPSWERNL